MRSVPSKLRQHDGTKGRGADPMPKLANCLSPGQQLIRWTVGVVLLVVAMLVSPVAQGIDQAMPEKLPPGHPAVGPMDATGPMGSVSTMPAGGMQRPAGAMDGRSPHGSMGAGFPRGFSTGRPPEDRTAFARGLDLTRLRMVFVHHNDQVKIMDSWARQTLSAIRNKQTLDGQDPLYTVLDMAFRPEAWEEKNIVYVQAIPIRQELALFAGSQAEGQRIMAQATVSPGFLSRQDVQERLEQISANTVLASSVNKVLYGYRTLQGLSDALLVVPPAPPARHAPWLHPMELAGSEPGLVAMAASQGRTLQPVAGFGAKEARAILEPYATLRVAWQLNDVAVANQAIAKLADVLPQVNPAEYPSPMRAKVELWYNRTFNGTIVAFVYFLAFALFAVSAMAGLPRVRWPALIALAIAVACHAIAMGVRWYLAGRIPIQNQFESVLGAALFGCVVGLVLEVWRRNGLFGMAMAGVGFIAMTVCFVFPFVVGTDMGATIGRVAGILSNTAWLYIHVNVVIASYSLIAASGVLGGLYLLSKLWHWVNPLEVPQTAALAMAETGQVVQAGGGTGGGPSVAAVEASRRGWLEALDGANVVVMQMAFWLLGTGIIFGAIWADVSWGRPWGWDPKETFALVTWLVYLIIIHVRLFSPRAKGDWTAWLSIVGFGVMLFNYIGVNFLLVGLHSYA